MQRWLLVSYRHFRITCCSHLQGSDSLRPFKMEPIGCPKTSVTDYRSALRNIPEEQSCPLHCVRSLKSCIIEFISPVPPSPPSSSPMSVCRKVLRVHGVNVPTTIWSSLEEKVFVMKRLRRNVEAIVEVRSPWQLILLNLMTKTVHRCGLSSTRTVVQLVSVYFIAFPEVTFIYFIKPWTIAAYLIFI